MAYDFGTNTLGIKNPFKPEGLAKSIAGVAICILGVIALTSVSKDLKVDMLKGWLDVALGLSLLTWGLRHLGFGLFQLFKFFVGRSVPTSLAYNKNASEKDNAESEKDFTVYTAQELESMLMGRKNSTFIEPEGWLARLVHSFIPKLVTMPYPIRNFVQDLAGLISSTLLGLIAFGIAYFVSVSGLVGSAGTLITPVLSILLLIYLIFEWRTTAKGLTFADNRSLHRKDASGLAKLFSFAIIVPVIIGFVYSKLNTSTANKLHSFFENNMLFSAWFNLLLLLAISLCVIALCWVMIRERLNLLEPETAVSEYRENMQESVHPNEIFINIENIVLANRRYKEIPNRNYLEFDPVLQEQSEGKGSFKGQLLIETQPEVLEIEYSRLFTLFRLASTIVSQSLIFIAALLFFYFVNDAYSLYQASGSKLFQINNLNLQSILSTFSNSGLAFAGLLTIFFSWQTVAAAGKILARGTNIFWSEMYFNSLLLWMKTEGTYTESKVSTGMSIHDSTRSENVVVRSSITPWMISSRITSSTFALSGTQNLEMPRFVMSMSKNENELNTIISEIKSFLRNREAIASITNEKDLSNAETIYQVNQTSRAHMIQNINVEQSSLEEQAAGKLRHDQDASDDLLE